MVIVFRSKSMACATNIKMLDVILLHQLPGLYFSQTAEHFPKLIQRYKVWVTGEVVLIEFSAFHIAISLSKNLVIEDAVCYNNSIFWPQSRVHGCTSLPASLVSHFFGR